MSIYFVRCEERNFVYLYCIQFIKTKLCVFETMNFLDNFDPEKSARERRKLTRKSYFENKPQQIKPKTIYNEHGQIASTGRDLCDCLDGTCPGCHFPCPKCTSNKCGHECRVNRRWMYVKIEVEGLKIL